MYNKVLALLQEEYPEVDFTSSDELVDEGILDSLTLTGIIAALSMEFDIEIPYDEIIEENFNSSNIGKTLNNQSFDSFDLMFYPDEKTDKYPCTPRENMRRNLAVCKTFADKFDSVKKSLLLIGGTGLGKTFLSTCVAKRLLMSGKSVIYISAVDFFKRIEKSRFDSTDSDIRMFENCDLLIIDDLGTEAPSVYTTAVFSDILDKRWRCGKKLMISSNNRLSDFERLYGERVFSRIAGGFECLLFYGRDIRVQKFMNGDS